MQDNRCSKCKSSKGCKGSSPVSAWAVSATNQRLESPAVEGEHWRSKRCASAARHLPATPAAAQNRCWPHASFDGPDNEQLAAHSKQQTFRVRQHWWLSRNAGRTLRPAPKYHEMVSDRQQVSDDLELTQRTTPRSSRLHNRRRSGKCRRACMDENDLGTRHATPPGGDFSIRQKPPSETVQN